MSFDPDNWESTKKMFKGVGKIMRGGLKFAGETLYEGYAIGSDKPQRYTQPRIARSLSQLPSKQFRVPTQQKSLSKGFKVHNPYTQGRKATHGQVIDNPFPRNISEELGIPHRERISAREYELIRKDMIRRGLH